MRKIFTVIDNDGDVSVSCVGFSNKELVEHVGLVVSASVSPSKARQLAPSLAKILHNTISSYLRPKK